MPDVTWLLWDLDTCVVAARISELHCLAQHEVLVLMHTLLREVDAGSRPVVHIWSTGPLRSTGIGRAQGQSGAQEWEEHGEIGGNN